MLVTFPETKNMFPVISLFKLNFDTNLHQDMYVGMCVLYSFAIFFFHMNASSNSWPIKKKYNITLLLGSSHDFAISQV